MASATSERFLLDGFAPQAPDDADGEPLHPPDNYRPRHGYVDLGLTAQITDGVKQSLCWLINEHDLPLVVMTGLTALGVIFNVFALVAYTFHMDPSMAFIVGCFGTSSWIMALGIWLFFLVDPEPKHRGRR